MQLLSVGQSSPTIWTHPRVRFGVGGVTGGLTTAGAVASVSIGGTEVPSADLTDQDTSQAEELTAAASEGDTTITVSAGLSCERGDQLTLDDDGDMTHVEVRAKPSSTTITLAEPLPRDIANGAGVYLTRLGVTLASGWVAEDYAGQTGIAIFEATLSDASPEARKVRWEESFRIVRRVTTIALTPSLLTKLYPSVRGLRSTSDVDYEEAIEASWLAVIEPMLAAKGILHEDIITDDVIVPVHALATVLHLARQARSVEPDYVARMAEHYEQTKATLFQRIDLAIRSQDDELPAPLDPGGETPLDVMRFGR